MNAFSKICLFRVNYLLEFHEIWSIEKKIET